MNSEAECPRCKGVGGTTGLGCKTGPEGIPRSVIVHKQCKTCGGSGSVSVVKAGVVKGLIERGRALRNERVANGVRIREMSDALGVGPVAYSSLEFGEIDDRALMSKAWAYLEAGASRERPKKKDVS